MTAYISLLISPSKACITIKETVNRVHATEKMFETMASEKSAFGGRLASTTSS